MRILLLTDSLGCPRKEISVEKTWTDKIIRTFSSPNCVFYTMMKHGLDTNSIDYQYIKEIHPDLIVCQIGIVDCVRRAIHPKILKIIRHLPIIRTICQAFLKKYHFIFTKIFCFKNVKPMKFIENIIKIRELCENNKMFFIRIADAGKVMIDKVYNCQNDILQYNEFVKQIDNGVQIIDPYHSYEASDYLLEIDGHHLNEFGNTLVYNKVYSILKEEINNEEFFAVINPKHQRQ